MSEKKGQFCYPRVETRTFIYKWIIKKFNKRPEKIGESFKSSTFICTDIKNHNWFLLMYPKGQQSDDGNLYIDLYLVPGSNKRPKSLVGCTVKFELCIQNQKGETLGKSRSTTFPVDMWPKDWGWSNFLQRDLLRRRLPYGELTVLFTLSIQRDVQYDSNANVVTPKCRVTEDLGQLLSNEDLSDITILVKEQPFKAHKAILAARSPVFAAMFNHDMQETRNNLVKISEIDPDVFQDLLQFIYTGKCSNIKTFPEKLLEVSDKYGLDRLKAMCEDVLAQNLTVKNAASTLTLGDLHSAHQLTSVAVTFIISHYTAVRQTNGWKCMKISPALQMLIDRALPTTTKQAS